MTAPPLHVLGLVRASFAALRHQPQRIVKYGWPILVVAVVRMAAYPAYAFLQVDPVGQAPFPYWLLHIAETLGWAVLLVALTRQPLDDTDPLPSLREWLQRIGLYWAKAVVVSGIGVCAGLVVVWVATAVVTVVDPAQAMVRAAMLIGAGLGLIAMVVVATRWGLALPGTAIGAERRSFAAAFDDMRFHMRRATTAGVLAILPGVLVTAVALTLMSTAGPSIAGWLWGLAAALGRILLLAALAGLHAELYSHLSGTGYPPEPPDPDSLDGNLRSLQRRW